MTQPTTHAGRQLLEEIEHWREVAAANIELGAAERHELMSIASIGKLAAHLVPLTEQQAALAATTEPRWPPTVTK